jgi:radical SAM/Cys-rich protein
MEACFGNTFEALTGSLPSYPVTGLQINLGRLCNLSCNHCHLSASPVSREIMNRETMREVARVINENSSSIKKIDITGGAPELNPDIGFLIESIHRPGLEIQLRTNLVAMIEPNQKGLAGFFHARNIDLTASLPCYQEPNVRAQRGDRVFEKCIEALKLLNSLGYGTENNPHLNLVYNPGGAVLPGRQAELEIIYRRELQLRYGIVFSKLFVLTNMPIGRFRSMLVRNNQLNDYLALLKCAFNKGNLSGLMCRNQVSVGWDGTLYDCDFNLALELPLAAELNHISGFDLRLLNNRFIVTGEHCFGCTAGAGSSCGGILEAGGQ